MCEMPKEDNWTVFVTATVAATVGIERKGLAR